MKIRRQFDHLAHSESFSSKPGFNSLSTTAATADIAPDLQRHASREECGPHHVDVLNGQTLRDLEVIADREGMITEQVMSQALDWCSRAGSRVPDKRTIKCSASS